MNPLLWYLCYFITLAIILFSVVWYYLDCREWNSGYCRLHSYPWGYLFTGLGARVYFCGSRTVFSCQASIFWPSVDKPKP